MMEIAKSYRAFLEQLAELRFASAANERLQVLIARNNSGELDSAEREELAGLATLSEYMSLVRGQSLALLGVKLGQVSIG